MMSERALKEKVEQMEKDFNDDKSMTFAVTADNARQYKALQEALIHRINSLETTLTEQKEELDMQNHELKEMIRDKDDEIREKEATIADLTKRMDDMCDEFADMLDSTLKLMKGRMSETFTGSTKAQLATTDYDAKLQEYSNNAYGSHKPQQLPAIGQVS